MPPATRYAPATPRCPSHYRLRLNHRLLTLDPLSAMAEADAEALERLLQDIDTDDPALWAMIDELLKPKSPLRSSIAKLCEISES
jgi:hypothetical protein